MIPLMLFVTLFMGRKAIGELPVFDFLVILILGALVGADIADPDIRHIPTAFAIVSIGIVQKIFSVGVLKFRWFGKLITFEPIIVISKGKFIAKNIRKTKYSIDNILQMLREEKIFDVTRVEIAVIEANGKLSILEKANRSSSSTISYPIVREGKIEKRILRELGINELWVDTQLAAQQIQINEVFLVTVDDLHRVSITKYMDSDLTNLPPVHH
ncbi:DUF421 domain-containing protein [Paenibacillus polymyxa]|nr:YetF domain-containing protein [Paenibacillus polymyxa]MDN4078749.1 DUF421 domain-containing protein [Paenibacillus polymyxa]MDN4104169.1 DUF421 domain-containing protein [Paenibacillus polymyxa]